ncbi:hypothetical protein FJZ18_04490 [Candidatus Pacearchaeota archaeon]|nr:hypothetical protein [Candidatus Pacearchaeota archaeon]
MGKTFIAVRDVDEDTFRKLRARAIAERKKIGDLLTMLMKKYLEETQSKSLQDNLEKVKKALDFRPIDFGPGNERLSEKIDEILYGKENDNN